MDKLLFVLLGSVTVLLQVALNHNTSDFYHVWALVISALSTLVCVVLLLFLRLDRSRAQDVMGFAALLLLVIWVGGTSLMTVKSPFTVTGNGYFGAWIALVMSWLLAVDYFPALKVPMDSLVGQGGTMVAALTIASLTVFGQTLFICLDRHHSPNGETVWILICSGVSSLITALLHIPSMSGKVKENFKFVALFLAIWWTPGFFIATFDSPYVHTGNGFFGCWVAIITSAMLFESAWGLQASEGIGSSTRKVGGELLIVTLGSIVTLIAATYDRRFDDFWGTWAVVCSAVSTAICVFLCLIMILGASQKVSSYMNYISWFLLVWWAFGAGFMTFKHPFVATSNGYFGAWLAVYAAFMYCQAHSETMRGWIGQVGSHGNLLIALTVASATLLVQTLIDTVDSHRFENEVIAWICSVVSLLVSLLIVVLKVQDDALKWIMLGMLVLWSIGVGFLTFDGPYVFTSNAYFACWAALSVSKTFVLRLFPDVVPRSTPATESQSSAPTGPVAKVVGAVLDVV